MGVVSSILGGLGLGLGVYGQYRSAQDAKNVYEYNQALAKYQSKYIQDAADIEEAQLNRDVAQYIGRQRAIIGRSGTTASSSSNLKTIEATQREADIDAAIIRYKADLGSWSAKSQASLLGTQASQFNAASYINPSATLLTGLSKWDYRNLLPASSKSSSLNSRQLRLGV